MNSARYSNLPPTADTATPFARTRPLPPTPNRRVLCGTLGVGCSKHTAKSQISDRRPLYPTPPVLSTSLEPPRSKPPLHGFERPNLVRIAILAAICLSAYPTLYVSTIVAKDRSLFAVRVIVAVFCSGVGFALGYVLLKIGVQHFDAAMWATVIHMSYEGKGMKLGDLARSSQTPTSFLSGFWILLSRFKSKNTSSDSRGSYDKRPWSLFIAFFTVLAVLAPSLPFLFGRIMMIETFTRNQRMKYREVLITGDLSPDDISRATERIAALNNYARLWTLLPYGRNPPDTSAELGLENDTVYFAPPSSSQLAPGGQGFGTFDANQTTSISQKGNPNDTLALLINGKSSAGSILRYPQWGVRFHCEKLPDPTINLIPLSDQLFTYVFLPQDFLRDLFGTYGMDLPALLTRPNFRDLDPNDTIPSTIDSSKVSYAIKFPGNSGGTYGADTSIIDHTDEAAEGWSTVETVLIRLNTSYTPNGRFPVYSNVSVPDANGVGTRIGFDVAVCVGRYEPWIIEVYNTSTGSPTPLRIVGNVSSLPNGKIQGNQIQNTRYLNSTGKNAAFYVAAQNSFNQLFKDNELFFGPSPSVVAFTEGAGFDGYIELSPQRYGIIRARLDTAGTLPYLVGSGQIIAQSYPDQELAYVTYTQWQLIGLPMLVLLLGIVAELFVPKLPFDVPRREFGVYSWLALFQSQELQFEAADELDKLTSLKDLEKRFSDKGVKFVVQ